MTPQTLVITPISNPDWRPVFCNLYFVLRRWWQVFFISTAVMATIKMQPGQQGFQEITVTVRVMTTTYLRTLT